MSKSSEMALEIQQIQATRENLSFQQYVESVKNAPSPKDLMNIAIDAMRVIMDENNISIYAQSIIIGMTIEYGNASVQNFLQSAGNKVPELLIDHALQVQGVIS